MKVNRPKNSLYELYKEEQKKAYQTPKNKEELKVVLEFLLKDFRFNKSKVYDRVFELNEIFYKSETNEKLQKDKDLLIEFLSWKNAVSDGINNDMSVMNYNPYWSGAQENLAFTSMKKIMDLFFIH